jgi:hypothetical protein
VSEKLKPLPSDKVECYAEITALRADVNRLQAELAKPEPMVSLRLVEGIRDAFVRRSVVGEAAVAVAIDAAIRAAREGE